MYNNYNVQSINGAGGLSIMPQVIAQIIEQMMRGAGTEGMENGGMQGMQGMGMIDQAMLNPESIEEAMENSMEGMGGQASSQAIRQMLEQMMQGEAMRGSQGVDGLESSPGDFGQPGPFPNPEQIRNGAPPPSPEERKADNYSFDITGDPHYSVDGTIDGKQVDTSFDSQDMGTQTQLKAAGYELDTTTGAWGDAGATVVKEASVTTGYGPDTDRVTLDADGNLSIDGKSVALDSGESLDLNGSSSIYRNTDGSYKINSQSGNGSISTTLTSVANDTGNYLNIHAEANNVRSDGFVEKKTEQQTAS